MTSRVTVIQHPGSLLKDLDLDERKFLALVAKAAELQLANDDASVVDRVADPRQRWVRLSAQPR